MSTITNLGFAIGSTWDPVGIKAAQADILKLSEQITALTSRVASVNVVANTAVATEQVAALKAELTSAAVSTSRMTAATDLAAQSQTRLAAASEASAVAIARSSEAAAASAARSSESAATQAGFLSGALTKVGKVGAAAFVFGVFESVRAAGKFETAMMHLQTDANETVANMGKVGAGLQQMAKDTGTSSVDLANAIYHLESSGYHGADALKAMQSAAEGAKVGGSDLAATTQALARVMYAMHDPADKATSDMDGLIKATSLGDVRLNDLAQAMGTILPAGHASKVGLEDILGAMSVMTANGSNAAMAATHLRQTILQLENPTAKARQQMSDLGLSYLDVAKTLETKGKGIPAVFQMMQDAITSHLGPGMNVYIEQLKKASGSTDDFDAVLANLPPKIQTQVSALANMTGGTKSLQAVLQLSGTNLAQYKDAVAQVTAAMSHHEAHVHGWEVVEATFQQKVSETGQSFASLGVTIGTATLPALGAFVSGIKNVNDWLQSNHNGLIALALTLGSIIALWVTYKLAMMAAAIAQGAWNVVVGISTAVMYLYRTAIGQTMLALYAQSAATKAMAAAQWLLNIAMDANPMVLIGIAIVALIGFIVYLATQTRFFQQLWHVVWDALVIAFRATVNWLKNIWSSLLDGIMSAWRFVSGVLRGAWDMYWNALKDSALFIWRLITGVITTELNAIRAIWDAVSGALSAVWHAYWDAFKLYVTGIWDAITSVFTTFGDKLNSGLRSIVDMARTIWDGLREAFAKPINAVIGFSNDTIGKVIPGIHMEPIHLASGGEVYGSGGPRDDKVPAMLSNGEFVVNAGDAQKNLNALHHMNSGGTIMGYKDGGVIGSGGIGTPTSPIAWMIAQAASAAPALKVTSTDRPGDPGWHGKGKAVDFSNGSDDTPEMQHFASWIAATWGSGTLELIHSPFAHNIKDGKDVGDGFGLYGANTMAEHRNHVHWAVPKALDSQGGGILDTLSGAAGKVLSAGRGAIAEAFRRLTDPVLNAIVDPMLGSGKPFGSFPKSLATKGRDALANLLSGAASTGAIPLGGVLPVGEHRSLIESALALTHTPPPGSRDAWLTGMDTLVQRESGWNPAAINMTDSNAAAGHPSKGLAQTIDSTFNSFAVPGYNNIWAPVDNLAASINYIKSRYGDINNVQQANSNLPPRGYATGTSNAAPGMALVGENGPEIVNFKGGEEVTPLSQLGNRAEAAGRSFVQANIDQGMSDLGISVDQNNLIPQLFTQSFSYGQQLASWAEQKQGAFASSDPSSSSSPGQQTRNGPEQVHFHAVDMDAALKKWNQQIKIHSMGFDPWGSM